MYYRVKNYVSLNKTSLTYPAHSICLGQILTNAWSITVAVVITARNGVLVMSVPAPLVMKWILRIRIALVTKWQFLIIHFQFLGRFFSSSCCIFTLPADCSSSSSILAYPRKVLHESSKIFSEHSLHFARKQSRNRALYNRARGTAGSVMTISLPLNGCLHSKNQFDERKQDWLVQKLGCGDFKGLTRFLMPV